MRDVQNRHLRPTPATGRFHRLARAIEHPHIGYRARSAAAGSLDQSAPRANGRKVIPYAAPAPHGLGRFRHGRVNARLAADLFGNGIAYPLYTAIDKIRKSVV